MTAEELTYILKKPIDAKLDLLYQLREFEHTEENEEFLNEIKVKLDQILGIVPLLRELDDHLHNILDNVYILPEAFGKQWTQKPTKHQLELAPVAVEALSDLINSKEWNLSFYSQWRGTIETCSNCLKIDPVHHSCWMDPNGAMRNYYHQINDRQPSLDDIWGDWSGQYCCLFVRSNRNDTSSR